MLEKNNPNFLTLVFVLDRSVNKNILNYITWSIIYLNNHCNFMNIND